MVAKYHQLVTAVLHGLCEEIDVLSPVNVAELRPQGLLVMIDHLSGSQYEEFTVTAELIVTDLVGAIVLIEHHHAYEQIGHVYSVCPHDVDLLWHASMY